MPMFATFAVEDFGRSERFYQAAGFITLARVLQDLILVANPLLSTYDVYDIKIFCWCELLREVRGRILT